MLNLKIKILDLNENNLNYTNLDEDAESWRLENITSEEFRKRSEFRTQILIKLDTIRKIETLKKYKEKANEKEISNIKKWYGI